jgi:hypothetical protein
LPAWATPVPSSSAKVRARSGVAIFMVGGRDGREEYILTANGWGVANGFTWSRC